MSGTMKIKLPAELDEEMHELSEVNWELVVQRVVRRSLKQELERMLRLKRIVSKSKFTQEDVKELSEEVNEALGRRFRESL